MKVLLVEPGKHPRAVEIEHTLEEMYRILECDTITVTYPWEDYVALVCDDEGLFIDNPWNRVIDQYTTIKGNFFICGLSEDDFSDLPDELMNDVRRHLVAAFSEEYAQSLPLSTVEAIVENVMETFAYAEGCWNDTDIQFATARILLPQVKRWKVPVVWSMMGHLVVTAARAEHKAWAATVDVKGESYANLYRLYAEAQERGNEYIDLHDTIWDKNVPSLIASLREFGIEKFTFSSTWSSAVETAWLFAKEGCKLEGLVEINGQHEDIFTGEREKAHGYLFSL